MDEPFTGTIACHAHLCAAAGRWDGALHLLVSVAGHETRRPWLDVAWLRLPDLAELVDPRVVASVAINLASEMSDPADEEDREAVLPFLGLLRESVALHPDHPVLLWCGSAFARRTGAEDEAIAWARHSFDVEPSHQAAVMTGYALRPAVPPPSPAVAEAVRRAASIRWPSQPELHAHTATLATADPDDLLATLVHPPATPTPNSARHWPGTPSHGTCCCRCRAERASPGFPAAVHRDRIGRPQASTHAIPVAAAHVVDRMRLYFLYLVTILLGQRLSMASRYRIS